MIKKQKIYQEIWNTKIQPESKREKANKINQKKIFDLLKTIATDKSVAIG